MTLHRIGPDGSLSTMVALMLLLLMGPLMGSGPSTAAAAEPPREYVEATLWAELEPMFPQTDDYPLSRDEARQRLLEEAQFVISGMLYGFRFHYVPSDRERQVGEVFELEPVAQIPFGDPRLNVRETWLEERALHVKLEYRLRDFQHSRLEAWYSSAVPEIGGAGEAEMWDGPVVGKRDAVRNAVKNSIRGHLQGRTHNKPREIRGSVLFVEAPRLQVKAGAYRATVRIRVRVESVRAYEIF